MTSPIMNDDQKVLLDWIFSGINIPLVAQRKGDSGYLLNNMIAKYSLFADEYLISSEALRSLEENKVDLSMSHSRVRFYGLKKGFVYEHAIPVIIVREKILGNPVLKEQLADILRQSGQVMMVTRSEDIRLRKAGLRSKMPDGWKWGGDPLARYEAVGIKNSSKRLRVHGAVKR